ncbi:hypothetical protein KUCAC02_019324 [Chaenocephalus aceratus]|nr:hypothetical protein KUCAC02_019324 [Chaenocephalus aceratus]
MSDFSPRVICSRVPVSLKLSFPRRSCTSTLYGKRGMGNSRGHARVLSSVSVRGRIMVLSDCVDDNDDTLEDVCLLTGAPDDPRVLGAFCTEEDGLKLTSPIKNMGVSLPTFPKDIQTELDAKQPCHKVSTDGHKIVRILHETMAQHTMYPTHSEYIKVAKALIFRYPSLKDMEGNGYHTWHMSLKRQFKAERTPLVHHEVVRNMKQQFGHHRSPQAPENNQGSVTTSVRRSSDIISVSGEDESSIDAHTDTCWVV